MIIKPISLINCTLGLGEIPQPLDFNYFHPELLCRTEEGIEFIARMRLHITEPLDKLVFADPRCFPDAGYVANSVGSKHLKRKSTYTDIVPDSDKVISDCYGNNEILFYEISKEQIIKAILNGYDHQREKNSLQINPFDKIRIAFTCHDPTIIGGGNTILFRIINWLADLGIHVTVYSSNSCAAYPSWLRVNADFLSFSNYKDMCSAIQEDIVILFTMWHIEPMLKAHPQGKLIYHLRQTYEEINYGSDFTSSQAIKPAIEFIEGLPIGVITVSPHLRDWYRDKLGHDSYLITNGIDLKVFKPKGTIRNYSSNTYKIISVGNPLHYLKASNVLADALVILANRRPNLSFLWQIAAGQICEYSPYNEKKKPNNLEFQLLNGLNTHQMCNFYQLADILVNPSLYEGFGLPTLESLACGTPVVQADNYGLDSILIDHQNCIKVPVNDAQHIADAIDELISDGQLREQLQINGIETSKDLSLLNQFMMCKEVFSEIFGVPFETKRADRIYSRLKITQTKNSNLKKSPLVSVVIPTFNQANYLGKALDSLITQTYTNWEAVVINDGSTDSTEDVLKEYSSRDPRIKPHTKPNGGITSALNEGIAKASGDYFSWLSSDDLFYPKKLELLVTAFEQLGDDYALVYGGFDILYEDTGETAILPMPKPIVPGCEFPEAFRFDFIDGTAILARMDVMRELNGFNPPYKHTPDMELWMRIGSKGYRFHFVSEKVSVRRMHSAQASATDMIYCRYDALWITHYYLTHFHLLEAYRYFDLSKDFDRELFVEHWVERITHTDTNVNHPLNQSIFWKWLDEGIKPLATSIQVDILQKILKLLMERRNTTAKISFFIDKCVGAINQARIFQPATIRFTEDQRDFRNYDRSYDPLVHEFFNYAVDLLIKEGTPLFAQELTHHDVNKGVDTPYKLAHSMIRYLSQFPNPYHDIAVKYADSTAIPQCPGRAVELACQLLFSEDPIAYVESYRFDKERIANIEEVERIETRIMQSTENDRMVLQEVLAREPSDPMFYYWNALQLAGNGDYEKAIDMVWSISHLPGGELDWRMIDRMGIWLNLVQRYQPLARVTFIRVARKIISTSEIRSNHSVWPINYLLIGLRVVYGIFRWINEQWNGIFRRTEQFITLIVASIHSHKLPSPKSILAFLPKPVYQTLRLLWHKIKNIFSRFVTIKSNRQHMNLQPANSRTLFKRITQKLGVVASHHSLLTKFSLSVPLSTEDENFVFGSLSNSPEVVERILIKNMDDDPSHFNKVIDEIIQKYPTYVQNAILESISKKPSSIEQFSRNVLRKNPELFNQILADLLDQDPIHISQIIQKDLKFSANLVAHIAYTGEGTEECIDRGCLPVPIHYYFPIPDINDLEKRDIWSKKNPLYGINFRQNEQLNTLRNLGHLFGEECNWPEQETADPLQFFTNNGSFSFGCAATLHCMIRANKPRHIIEVGSGNSSLVISAALQKNIVDNSMNACEYIVIDPYPRKEIEDGLPYLSRLIKERVELTSPDIFSILGENDILFIDSSHSVKAGSDVVFLILDILPQLAPGCIVHFHDIPIPKEYAKTYFTNPTFRVLWTESYLLQAFLALNDHFRILLAMGYLMENYIDDFSKVFPHFNVNKNWANSGSFWIRREKNNKRLDSEVQSL